MNLLSLILILTGTSLDCRIVDAVTGEPVPYVQITLLSRNRTITADSAGYFRLELDSLSAPLTLRLERIGYRTRIWTGTGSELPERLSLTPVAIPVSGVTSTATRLQTRLAHAVPVKSRTIDPLLVPDNLTSPLSREAGVLVNDYGNLATLSLRGAGPEQTLVLWDRVRLNSSLNGLFDLALLPADHLERFEIARGGASALYGTSALGGVINLITPEPRQRRLAVTAGLGSLGTRTAGLTAALPGPVSLLAAGEYFHTDNRYDYTDTAGAVRRRTNADLTRTSLLFKSQTTLGTGHCLGLETGVGICRRGSPGPVSFPSESARLDDDRLLVITSYDLLESPAGRLSARLYHSRHNERYFNPDPWFGARDTHRISATGLNLNHELTLALGPVTGALLSGIETGYDQAQSTTVGAPARLNAAGYIETGLKTRLIQLLPALRYEIIQHRNPAAVSTLGALSPRLNLTLTPHRLVSCYFGINRSFRAPSFNELFWPEDPWSRGNPRLRPEWGTGWDAGIGIRLPAGGLRITGFSYRIRDLIQWLPDTGFVWQPVNIARVGRRGLELEPELDLGLIGLDGNITVQECRTESTFVPYRPPLTGSARIWLEPLKMPVATFRLQLEASGTAPRFTDEANTDTLPGYLKFDLGTSLKLKTGATEFAVAFGIQNLLDRRYELIRDYPLPGRTFYLKTRLAAVQGD